jgi:glycosyltransferase involved in cell wall biosynthesis
MKIILIHKAEFHKRPPVISVMESLLILGYNPVLITCGITEKYKKELIDKNVDVYIFSKKEMYNRFSAFKIIEYLMFRKFVFSIINKYANKKSDLLLWIEGAYTMVALGKNIKKYNYILQIQELHEKDKLYLYVIGKVIHEAKAVFMPEYNRTVLYQIRFKLKQRPVVLPNKPYFIPSKESLEQLKEKYKDKITIFQKKKVILYQGQIFEERNLSNYIRAIKRIGKEYQIILLGHDHGILQQYLEIDPELIHIDFVPAPDYLLFTSLAYIGIVSYNPYELNSAYCAPNKIYEYAAFSLPMLGNDIPGLKHIFEQHKIGVLVNENDENSIINGISEISNHLEKYKEQARKFYDTVDNIETINNILNKMNNENIRNN